MDTSTWVAYLEGEEEKDCLALDNALEASQVLMPNPVLSELLSEPKMKDKLKHYLLSIPRLPEPNDYWVRVGKLRAKILSKSLKAKLADSLIAQSCIDNQVSLLTRDKDFITIAKHSKLSLVDKIII